jgi:hypothetical protein
MSEEKEIHNETARDSQNVSEDEANKITWFGWDAQWLCYVVEFADGFRQSLVMYEIGGRI